MKWLRKIGAWLLKTGTWLIKTMICLLKITWSNIGSLAQILLVVIAGLAVWISWVANQSTIQSLQIENRPILSFQNRIYQIDREKMSFKATLDLINSGRSPAHEFKKINDKILFVTKERKFNKFLHSQAQLDEEYFFYRKGILELLLQFFKNNPRAKLEDVRKHFTRIRNNPDLVDNGYLKDDENKIAFKVDGYGDVLEWSGPPSMFGPGLRARVPMGRSSGNEVDQLVDNGTNMLVVFLGLEYEGIVPRKKFELFFLGFYDNRLGQSKREKFPRELRSFSEWTTRDELWAAKRQGLRGLFPDWMVESLSR